MRAYGTTELFYSACRLMHRYDAFVFVSPLFSQRRQASFNIEKNDDNSNDFTLCSRLCLHCDGA